MMSKYNLLIETYSGSKYNKILYRFDANLMTLMGWYLIIKLVRYLN